MVAKDVAAALSDDAKRQGRPLSSLANDLVKLYLRAREKGYDLETVFETFDVLMFARKTGHVLISEEVYDILLGKGLTGKVQRFLSTGKESGQKIGRYIETIYANPIDGLKHILPNMFWDLSFELRFDGVNGTLCITCSSKTMSRAQLALAFVQGFLESCNFNSKKTEVMHGLVKVDFGKAGL